MCDMFVHARLIFLSDYRLNSHREEFVWLSTSSEGLCAGGLELSLQCLKQEVGLVVAHNLGQNLLLTSC